MYVNISQKHCLVSCGWLGLVAAAMICRSWSRPVSAHGTSDRCPRPAPSTAAARTENTHKYFLVCHQIFLIFHLVAEAHVAAHVEDAVHRGLVTDLALLRPRVLAAAAAGNTKYHY